MNLKSPYIIYKHLASVCRSQVILIQTNDLQPRLIRSSTHILSC